ncbi:DNA damage response protein kinase DUN1 [Trichoderma lentiforme]|uniref:DNA damage response protein kinase DUN1 n=1 Tax=Trichoderma lentiforme TaxID=1567552 RepID=A0A9P5C8B9_9HYPO|nr:DNA damage response protein kinase DUN1 [Trichoderma lentiforme]
MSGPLNVSTSVVAVLQLAATATQYLKDIKHGSADRSRLRDELRSTVCLLEMLQDRLEDSNDLPDSENILMPQSISLLGGADGPLHLFRQVLEEIIAELAPQDKLRQLAKPFTWPFDKKKVAELLNRLERSKSHFGLVLQNNIVDLVRLANLKLDKIGDKVESSEAKSRDSDSQKIIQWISALSFRSRHVNVLDSVQPGTGIWLLEHATFRDWVKSKTGTLWCPGIPGAGKTSLASLIINHLEQEPPQENTFCSFIYCDYHQRSAQTQVALLSSILQQILQNYSGDVLPSEVVTLYNQHQKYKTHPTLTQITEILGKLVSTFEMFHVVVDALDECAESEEDALRFISAVSSLGSSVKILCTSRSSSVFDAYFSTASKIEISAQQADITTFITACLQDQVRLSKHVAKDAGLRDDIIGAIIQESQGMFLLAKLHVESLSRKISRKDVRTALKTLPSTLDATYSDALERIYSQDSESAELAELILFWVVSAKRSLTVQDLQHLYATRELSDGDSLDEDDIPDGDILTGVCSGLITVDEESQLVRLVHYTAQQYFENCHHTRLLDAKMSLASISLTYLTLSNFSSGFCTTDAAMSLRLKQFPFLVYAAKYWGSDLAELDCADIGPRIEKFSSEAAAVEAVNQAWSLNTRKFQHTNWSQEFPRHVPVLVLISAFCLPEVLQYLVSKGHKINARGSDGETALIRSAGFGHIENVQTLLRLGAEVDAQDHMDETALQRAARAGNETIAKILLEKGADVNMKAASDLTALMSAVSSGNLEVVKTLVEAGADFKAETVWGDSALSIATRSGQEAIANYLSDQGAVLPKGPAGRRASIIASRKGLHQLVRKLTANYDAVADKPLERQSSRLMEGLSDIHEAEQAASDTKTEEVLPEQTRADSRTEFLDDMEEIGYNIGFHKRYDLLQQLGKGHFAEVYLCANRVTGVRYAVKVRIFKSQASEKQRSTELFREAKMMRFLQKDPHPNILRFVDLFAEHSFERTYLIMELVPDGELFNYIVLNTRLSEDEARKVFLQLFSALEFLHDQGCIHRDIKPENILLADEKNLVIKISDFGLAKIIGPGTEKWEWVTTLCGTPSYVAPEILATDSKRKYGFPVDIWSSGVVLYICLCGFPPFSDELYSKEFPFTLTQQIKTGRFDYPSPYWDPVGDPALDLIDSMLVVDMEKRFTVRQCLEHPWMREAVPQILAEAIRSESPEPMEEGEERRNGPSQKRSLISDLNK